MKLSQNREYNTILLIGDISEIYINSFQKMLADPNFRSKELSAIVYGYTVLLEQSTEYHFKYKR